MTGKQFPVKAQYQKQPIPTVLASHASQNDILVPILYGIARINAHGCNSNMVPPFQTATKKVGGSEEKKNQIILLLNQLIKLKLIIAESFSHPLPLFPFSQSQKVQFKMNKVTQNVLLWPGFFFIPHNNIHPNVSGYNKRQDSGARTHVCTAHTDFSDRVKKGLRSFLPLLHFTSLHLIPSQHATPLLITNLGKNGKQIGDLMIPSRIFFSFFSKIVITVYSPHIWSDTIWPARFSCQHVIIRSKHLTRIVFIGVCAGTQLTDDNRKGEGGMKHGYSLGTNT